MITYQERRNKGTKKNDRRLMSVILVLDRKTLIAYILKIDNSNYCNLFKSKLNNTLITSLYRNFIQSSKEERYWISQPKGLTIFTLFVCLQTTVFQNCH